MGPASHIRVSPSVDLGTLADKVNVRDNVLVGGVGKDLRRDQRALVQGYNCRGNDFQGKLCITNFSSGKEGGAKTCNKSKMPEQLCEDRTLHILPDLIQEDNCMIKLDLKDAYLQIPIHQECHHLLQFQWNSQTYQFQCLPFGLTLALCVFLK